MNNDEHLNVLSPPGDKSFINDEKIDNFDKSSFIEQPTVASEPLVATPEPAMPEVQQPIPAEPIPTVQTNEVPGQFVEMPAQVQPVQVEQPVVEQQVMPQAVQTEVMSQQVVAQPMPVAEPVQQPVMPEQVQPTFVGQPIMPEQAQPVQQMMVSEPQTIVPQPMPADPGQPVMPQQIPADPMQTAAPQPMVAEPVIQPAMEQMVQPAVAQTSAATVPESAPAVQSITSAFLQQDEQHPVEEPQVYVAPEAQPNNSEYKPFEYENKSNPKGTIIVVAILIGILVGGGLLAGSYIMSLFSVSNDINNSRDSNYLQTASNYIKYAGYLVNAADKVQIEDEETLYLIPVGNDDAYSCIRLESGGGSPYSSSFKMAYVGVTYDKDEGGYNYYFTSVDGSGKGIKFTSSTEIANGEASVEDVAKYAVKLHDIYLAQVSYESEIEDENDSDIPNMEEYANADKIIVLSQDECS